MQVCSGFRFARRLLHHHLLRLRPRDPRPRLPPARGAGNEKYGGGTVVLSARGRTGQDGAVTSICEDADASILMRPSPPNSSKNPLVSPDARAPSAPLFLYNFAIFISKTATFISKNAIFIYLIFNKLN